MKLDEAFNHIGRPFAYYPNLAKTLGVKATLFACFFLDLANGESKEFGIPRTKEEIEEATGLSIGEQRAVVKKLQDIGILKIKRVGLPAMNYYFFDWEKMRPVLIRSN